MRNTIVKIGELKKLESPFVDSNVVTARNLPCFKVEDDIIFYAPFNYLYFLDVEKGSTLIIDDVYSYNEFVVYVCVKDTFEKVALFFFDEKSVSKFFKTQEEFVKIEADELQKLKESKL